MKWEVQNAMKYKHRFLIRSRKRVRTLLSNLLFGLGFFAPLLLLSLLPVARVHHIGLNRVDKLLDLLGLVFIF